MIDFHSHIINGIDDGASHEEEALSLLNLASASGTTKIITTPHFYPYRFEEPYKGIKKRVQQLRTLVKENNINIEVFHGQEVFYSKNILNYFEEGIIGTLNDTRYMLIELSLGDFNIEEVLDNIYEVQIRGIVPILAHPERYRTFIKEPELINRFIQEGFLFQLNTGSLEGVLGREIKKLTEKYIENNIYSVIGSDAHNVDNRNTNMTKAIELINKMNSGYMERIKEYSYLILKNEEVEFSGEMIKKRKRIFSILKK